MNWDSNAPVGPGQPCWECGGTYGDHDVRCTQNAAKFRPRRFRVRCTEGHPNGTAFPYRYGVYFPLTDLVVGDMGGRGTGEPQGVEWIDK